MPQQASAVGASLPKFRVNTIASVGHVRWRPGARHQVASAAHLMDFKIHTWDVSNPFVPLASCAGHVDVVTGVHWSADGETIVSCSKDGSGRWRVLLVTFICLLCTLRMHANITIHMQLRFYIKQ
jgi:WD40 repeat protein